MRQKEKDKLLEIASQFRTEAAFIKYEGEAHSKCKDADLLRDIPWFNQRAISAWDDDMIIRESKKYKTTKEFREGSPRAYIAAYRRGMLEDLTWLVNSRLKWSEEATEAEARKYTTRSEFLKGSPAAYQKATRMGWIDRYDWMTGSKTIWTKEVCYAEAKKYTDVSTFRDNSNGAYVKACSKGWIKEYKWLDKKIRKRKSKANL